MRPASPLPYSAAEEAAAAQGQEARPEAVAAALRAPVEDELVV